MDLLQNKKAVGPIGAIMLFLVFLVMWFVWLGPWINEIMAIVVTTTGATGIEAFFFENFNFVILVCLILGMLGWLYWGGGE